MAPTENTSAGSPLLAAGLFIATALASQWLQHYLLSGDNADDISDIEENSQERRNRRRLRQRVRRQREQQQQQQQQQQHHSKPKKIFREPIDEEDEGYQEDEDLTPGDQLRPRVEFRDYYKMRRLGHRLSFENPFVQTAESGPQNTAQQYPTGAHQRTHNNKKSSQHSSSALRARPVGSAVHREDEYDFLPKNSNWNHFEKYNEDDVENGVVVPGPASPANDCHHFQAFSNGRNNQQYRVPEIYPDEISTEAENQAEGSDSSEEPQFVWTEVVHEKRSSRNSPRRRPKVANADATDFALPVLLAAQGPTIDDELPSPARPVRWDSQATEPTNNKQAAMPTTTVSPEQQPAEQRRYLSHVNSLGASDSAPESFPQRFQQPSKLERASSGASSVVSSEISTSSDPPVHNHTNRGYSDDVVSSSHRSARAQYNAKIMPNKVVMVRHGQSMGNINEDLYSTTPDNAMPLTELGWEQARRAGQHLKANVLAPSESVHFIVSPYARTVETFHGIVSAWCDPDSPEFAAIPNREMRLKAWYGRLLELGLTWHEDPRIREQDFGNYQDPELIRKAKKDRHRFGTFYYRFPHGESASDVFDRVSTFLDSLWRSFDMNRSRNYVLVTHGISIRVLLARYFRYTIHQFNILSNPRNCEMVVLNHDGLGRLRLQGRCQLHLKEKKKKGEKGDEKKAKVWETDEYRFYKKLRILPQAAIRKVDIRISYSDTKGLNPASTS